jgi:hypothetical protein
MSDVRCQKTDDRTQKKDGGGQMAALRGSSTKTDDGFNTFLSFYEN